jgi:hypothetical protein
MNNKANSLTSWSFGILLILLIVIILGTSVLTPMNDIYNKNYSSGIDTSAIDDFKTLRDSADGQIQTGDVEQTSDGLSLKQAWSISKLVYTTTGGFITGSTYNRIFTDILGMPEIVATVITIISLISLILIIVYLFMKVKP